MYAQELETLATNEWGGGEGEERMEGGGEGDEWMEGEGGEGEGGMEGGGEGEKGMEGWGEVMKKKNSFWHKNAKVKTVMQYEFKDL